MLIFLVLCLVIRRSYYYVCVVRGRMSVLLLSDLFVHLDVNSFDVRYVQIFEQIKMDGWMDHAHGHKSIAETLFWLRT